MGDSKINPSLGMKVTLAGIRNLFSCVPQISTTKFYEIWSQQRTLNQHKDTSEKNNASLVLLDVREQQERDISFIQGSVWINPSDSTEENVEKVKGLLTEKLQDLNQNQGSQMPATTGNVHQTEPQQEINVVAYCSIGYRSSDLIKQLLEMSLFADNMAQMKINLFNLEGSLFKWANEDKPMVDKDGQPTKFAHPYNSLWGKLLNENRRKSIL